MFTNTRLSKAIRLAAMFGAASATCMSASASAQEAEGAEAIEKVSVTGSRIARTDLVATSPVNIISEEQIELTGAITVQDLVNTLPSAGIPGSTDTNSNFTVNSVGLNTVNLRNLGDSRTLVLVNGRRHVGGLAGSPTVDLSMIPSAMVERVEVVTGGASAVYGSEAISGVINFIMKDDFEGVEINGRLGTSDAGGADETDISMLIGGNFDGDKGNATVYFGYSDRGGLSASERKMSEADATNSSFGPKGGVFIGNQLTTLDTDTGLWNKPFVAAEDGFNRNAIRMIRVPTERAQFNANINYQVNDHVRVFSETAYSELQSSARLEPSIVGEYVSVGPDIQNIRIPLDYHFLPEELRTAALAEDPDATELTWFRRFKELGPRSPDLQRRVFRQLVGVDGMINDQFDYEVYYQYGNLGQDQVNSGVMNTLNVYNSLRVAEDDEGNLSCADDFAAALGCVPVNFFAGEDTVTGAALDWISVNPQTTSRMEQSVFGATVSGYAAELPAGDLGVAFGYEWREETSEYYSDALVQSGLTSSNTTPNTIGTYDVSEFFVEAIVPIVADLPFVEYLGVELAARVAEYSTIGEAISTKASIDWQVMEGLKVRGGVSTAVRAPNIGEMFNPGSETFRSFVDPCALGGVGGVSANGNPDDIYERQEDDVIANCATIPGTATLDPYQRNIRSAGGMSAGNPDLNAEESDTLTIGVVYSPAAIENLNFTVDYFDIEITNAISSFGAQTTIDQCVRQPTFPDNAFCSLIERDPTTGLVNRMNAQAINAAVLYAEGIDFSADYSMQVGAGTLDFALVGTYSLSNEYLPFVGGEVIDSQGEIGQDDLRFNLDTVYKLDDLTFALSTRYLDKVNISNQRLTLGTIDSTLYHDVQVRYTLNDNYEVFVGVDNLLDEEAPFLGQGVPGDVTGTNTAADVYDAIGRYFYAGFKLTF